MSEETLFARALEKPAGEERDAFLSAACGDDAALRERIEHLLRADEHPSGILDNTPAVPTVTSSPDSLTTGSVFAGRFKLREKLGEGGMGEVWVADQIEPVQRRVALKVIRPGHDSARLVARFDQERQALALMDHPNIARVLDAGVADSRPYFVMELIKGEPITAYCDAAKLSPRERLELFLPVCHAVQHAHQKGIIHRDLKPSNIMIGLYDGKPVPKVIDFGVAKATGPRLTEKSIYTEVGALIGTLEYMSPEQAELNNLDVDTRSDIYALGAVLYELLTGSVPFPKQQLQTAAFTEMLRIIKEVEPPKPSTRLSDSGTLPSIAAVRQTEPKKLVAQIRGELDWIVMKCLEKERGRRYETTNSLAMDVQRYLADEPVLAGPPSAGYRLRKFVRRNKGPVLAAAVVLLTLLAGMGGTTFGLFEAWRQEDIARREATAKELARQAEAEERQKAEAAKAEAQAKEAEANAVVAFFEDKVLAAARPEGLDGGLGRDVTLHAAISASLQALGQGFVTQPLVEARLRRTLGITFHYLAEHEEARNQSAQSWALFARHRGPDHRDTLQSMLNVATSYAGLNRPIEALKLTEEVLEIQKRVLPKDHPDSLRTLNNLGIRLEDLNRHAEAMKLREEVLAAQKRVLPKDHPDTLKSMHNLAVSFAALNRPAEAFKRFEEVLAIQKKVLTKDHPHTLMSMMGLANCYASLNRPAEALKLREEVLETRKRVLPKDHPDTLVSMNNLASSFSALNRPAEALKLRQEVLEIRKRLLPKDHPDTLISMNDLANSYATLNRLAEALELREEVLAAQKRVLPKDHPDTLISMNNLASSYAALNRTAEALKLWEETLAIRKRVLPKDHPDTLGTMNNLASSYATLNRPAEALKLREEVLAIRKRVLPKDHPRTLSSMGALAESLIQVNRGAEAIPLIDECLAKARGQAVDSRMIPRVMSLRIGHFHKIGDPAGCRKTAEMWEQLNRLDAESLYAAACFRAITSGVQAKTLGPDAIRLARTEADRAMELLNRAVKAGYKNAAQIKKDTDLDPLREREDFKKLLVEMQAGKK